MDPIITKRVGNWTRGYIGPFRFEIKHFDEPSVFGINEGAYMAESMRGALAADRTNEYFADMKALGFSRAETAEIARKEGEKNDD